MCVYVCGGLTIGYEAHGIGHQIRKTRTGIEGAGNARRRRAEEPLAQPIWHEAPSEDSPLSPGRGGFPPTATKGTARTHNFGAPLSHSSRQQTADPPLPTSPPKPSLNGLNPLH